MAFVSRRKMLLAALVLATPVMAQGYPTRPIQLVVPAAAGGATDIIARLIAEPMSQALGQRVVVENRGGAGGVIGVQAVSVAAPDGYTLVMGNIGPNAISPSLRKSMPYDNAKAFEPISLVAKSPNIVVVHPSLPVKSIAELVTYAKANPGKISFASSGNGQSIHMSGELFKLATGAQIVHVPYRGSGPALNDLLAGHVGLMFDNLASSLPHVRAGSLRALAITSARRWPSLPDLPTVDEAGVKGFDVTAWFGLLAPAGTPKPIVERLNAEVRKALATPLIQERLEGLGIIAAPTSPEEFRSFIAAETLKWAKVIEDAKIPQE